VLKRTAQIRLAELQRFPSLRREDHPQQQPMSTLAKNDLLSVFHWRGECDSINGIIGRFRTSELPDVLCARVSAIEAVLMAVCGFWLFIDFVQTVILPH
jgi:hypothetical protein